MDNGKKIVRIKLENAYDLLFNREVEVVFPVLHGLYGEDGTIQGLCKTCRNSLCGTWSFIFQHYVWIKYIPNMYWKILNSNRQIM